MKRGNINLNDYQVDRMEYIFDNPADNIEPNPPAYEEKPQARSSTVVLMKEGIASDEPPPPAYTPPSKVQVNESKVDASHKVKHEAPGNDDNEPPPPSYEESSPRPGR